MARKYVVSPNDDTNKRIIRTQEEVDDFVVLIQEARDAGKITHIGCDIETTEGFEDGVIWLPQQMNMRGIGFYASNEIQVFIEYNKDINYDTLGAIFYMGIPIVFHNAKFDCCILERDGIIKYIDEAYIDDTLIMSALLDENRMRHGLKYLAADLLGVENIVKYGDVGNRPTETYKSDGLFGDIPNSNFQNDFELWAKKMAFYCLDDCRNTYDLYFNFKEELMESPELWKVYEKLEIPFMKVLLSMETRGFVIDTEYLKELDKLAEDKLVDICTKIYANVGKEFNIGSNQQVAEIMLRDRGYKLPDEYKTDKGAYSMDVAAMEYLAATYNDELCNLMLEYRELAKVQGTYIKGIPKLAYNGAIHASFNQTGTVTGRLSSNKPNLQNIPRRADDFNIRKAFKPRPGYALIDCDRSQLELRVMAFFAQEPTMMKAFQEGKDIHKETADMIGCSRQEAKAINFGLIYGRTAHGLAPSINKSVEEAQKFIDQYFQKFNKVYDFLEKCKNSVKANGYVTTLTKRRRRFPDYNKMPIKKGTRAYADMSPEEQKGIRRERDMAARRMERQAGNACIQGSASDMAKIAMRNIHKKIKPMGAYILSQIHDEIIVEVPIELAEQVKEIVQHEMEHCVELTGVPIVAEPKITYEWEK